MRLNVLMSCTVFALCLCQGNGKALAQGLLVPIVSNGNKYPKMCPIPLSTALTQLSRRELCTAALSSATHSACSWPLSHTVQLQQLLLKALACPAFTVPAAATKQNFLHLQNSSTCLKPGALNSGTAE